MKKLKLLNGLEVPEIVFGCYSAEPQKNNFKKAIIDAIDAGFTDFDTASIYGTEKILADAIKESGIPRSKLQIASKAWVDEMGYCEIKEAFYRSLDRLNTDYLDVYLIHWPKSGPEDFKWKEKDLESWRAMEELYKAGVVKAIGVSNFLPHHLLNIMNNCSVIPSIDQLEIHPGYSQEAAVRFCLDHGIMPQAHSALGSGAMINNHYVAELAVKYEKTVPQICLKFLLQKGIVPVTKSSNPEHLRSNIDIFDFEISEEDLWFLSCIPQNNAVDDHPDFGTQTMKSDFYQ